MKLSQSAINYECNASHSFLYHKVWGPILVVHLLRNFTSKSVFCKDQAGVTGGCCGCQRQESKFNMENIFSGKGEIDELTRLRWRITSGPHTCNPHFISSCSNWTYSRRQPHTYFMDQSLQHENSLRVNLIRLFQKETSNCNKHTGSCIDAVDRTRWHQKPFSVINISYSLIPPPPINKDYYFLLGIYSQRKRNYTLKVYISDTDILILVESFIASLGSGALKNGFCFISRALS